MPTKAEHISAVRRAAVRNRWTPEARAAEAIRILVEQAPPLTDAQKDQLRPLLTDGRRARGGAAKS